MSRRLYAIQIEPGLLKVGVARDMKSRLFEHAEAHGRLLPAAWLFSPYLETSSLEAEGALVGMARKAWHVAKGREWFVTDEFEEAAQMLRSVFAGYADDSPDDQRWDGRDLRNNTIEVLK